MEPEFSINTYKRKFDRELRHVKVILMSQKNAMTKHAWIRLVMATKKSILTSPENYFRSIPEHEIYRLAIDKVFKGFLDDQKIRDAQRRL
jgi:hypothetical protein